MSATGKPCHLNDRQTMIYVIERSIKPIHWIQEYIMKNNFHHKQFTSIDGLVLFAPKLSIK